VTHEVTEIRTQRAQREAKKKRKRKVYHRGNSGAAERTETAWKGRRVFTTEDSGSTEEE